MTIQEAINSGKKIRRKSWANPAFKEFDLWNDLDSTDILATDWEVEEESDTDITFSCRSIVGDLLTIESLDGDLIFSIEKSFRDDVILNEEDVDKILTFLYNNTDIGKKRIIPF